MKMNFWKCVFNIFDCVIGEAQLLSLTENMYYLDVLWVIPAEPIFPLFMEMFSASLWNIISYTLQFCV